MLRELPAGGVLVLPYMYADYVCYWSGRPVVWGGHCGNHTRFEWIAPVIRRPLEEMLPELGVNYVLLDERFVTPQDLRLGEPFQALWRLDGFEVLGTTAVQPAAHQVLARGGSVGR